MSHDSVKKNSPDLESEWYQFRIQGFIDPSRSEWLGCPEFHHISAGETFFSCLVADQAALHGLLAKIRDMNLKLISVIRFEPELDENEVGLHENEE